MAKGNRESGRLSVFKGHEARLNRTIFQILALKSPLTIYDIHKEAKARKGLRHVRYASVNKRVRFLEESGHVKKIGVRKTRAGFQASIYELNVKGYLAMFLSQTNLDDLLKRVDDASASAILGAIINI